MYKLKTSSWYIVRILFVVAPTLTIISITATIFYNNSAWLFIAVFVSIMQLLFAFTGYCPMAIILDKAGVRKS